jgi:hypothetical protein
MTARRDPDAGWGDVPVDSTSVTNATETPDLDALFAAIDAAEAFR